MKMRNGLTRVTSWSVNLRLFVAAAAFALAPLAARAQGKPARDAGAQHAGRAAHGDEDSGQTRAAEQSTAAQSYAELPNFHAVNARLYRGGQPRAGGLQRLAALGVKTVINLRDDDARAAEEGREARSLGMRYFNVPLSRAHRPGAGRIEELFALIDAAENQPVFVHCKRGSDRTGALVAAYRITHDGWTAERALDEAETYGMGFWQRGKKDFIRDYERERPAPTPARRAESRQKATH
jgi:tyrosine-protein phosphatase SIW14